MKTIKIADAPNRAIDWLVAKAEGWLPYEYPGKQIWLERGNDARGAKILRSLHELAYTTDPAQAWPIIERERIDLNWEGSRCFAGQGVAKFMQEGPTSLTAAMRCYVASKFGETAEVPQEL